MNVQNQQVSPLKQKFGYYKAVFKEIASNKKVVVTTLLAVGTVTMPEALAAGGVTSLPSTSERLRIRMGDPDDALIGACRLTADRLLSPHVMSTWLPHGSPAGVTELITHKRQDA